MRQCHCIRNRGEGGDIFTVAISNGANTDSTNYSILTKIILIISLSSIKPSSNDDTDELVDLVKGLPLVKRAEAVLYLNELKNKK